MLNLDDTIVGVASAPGPGARAVVRLSGPDARRVVASVCVGERPAGKAWAASDLRLPGVPATLPARVLLAPGPRSYTGQDCAEIHLVSCLPLVEALTAALLDAGARAARPGEFTQRAFLAGKRDLTRAEAVLAVIEAGSDAELTQALGQLAGNLFDPLHALRDDLLNLLADTEAALDFSDEDIEFVGKSATLLRIGAALAQLTNLRKQMDERSLSGRAFRAVLAGPPNAGKSSLFNALAGTPAALVGPAAGTTRDCLTRTVALGDIAVDLVDTAGRAQAADAVEEQAQSLAEAEAARADLVVWCVPAEEFRVPSSEFQVPNGGRSLVVATKIDVGAGPDGVLATSAKTGRGSAS